MLQNWACTRLRAVSKPNFYLAILLACCVLVNVQGSQNTENIKTSGKELIDLHEDNWSLMLNGEWLVEFYAPWCPACKNLAPTWSRFASTAADFNVKVAKIDVTTSPSLSGRFFVTALPTIYHVINGEFRQYRGSRDANALLFFIKQKQWQKIEPLSAWKKPDTLHMSVLSYFFKLSHTLKDLNARLQDEYGLPTWGSYALFALGTIFVGAALGVLLVCVVDFLYPPKKSARQSFSEVKERDARQGVEDLANDELEDENADENDDEDEDEEEASSNEEAEQKDEKSDKEKTNNDDVEDADNSSDGEKNSNSEVESENPMTKSKNGKDEKSEMEISAKVAATVKSPSSPGEMRKRKPRKDD